MRILFKAVMKNAIFLAFILLMCMEPSYAQLAFFPDLVAVDLTDGETKTVVIEIVNEDDFEKKIDLEPEYRRRGECKLDISEWVGVSSEKISLKGKERKKIKLQLKGKAPGIRGETVLSLFSGERKMDVIPINVRIGLPVFVRWNDERRALGTVVSSKQSYEKGEFRLEIQVKNISRLHLAPFGVLWIEDAKGVRKWQSEIRPSQPIFSGETKSVTWEGGYPELGPGDTTLKVELFWGTLYGIESTGIPAKSALSLSWQVPRSMK